MNISEKNNRTLRIAICAMLAALGVVVLYIGSVIEVLDIAMAAIASMFVIFAVIEYGGAAAWSIYAVTGLLSAVLIPNKFPAAMYILFLGFYPILKEKIEKLKSKVWQWVLKETVFNICLVLLMLLAKFLLLIDKEWLVLEILFFFLANGTFVIFDIALTRLISLYIFRLRNKFKLK